MGAEGQRALTQVLVFLFASVLNLVYCCLITVTVTHLCAASCTPSYCRRLRGLSVDQSVYLCLDLFPAKIQADPYLACCPFGFFEENVISCAHLACEPQESPFLFSSLLTSCLATVLTLLGLFCSQ